MSFLFCGVLSGHFQVAVAIHDAADMELKEVLKKVYAWPLTLIWGALYKPTTSFLICDCDCFIDNVLDQATTKNVLEPAVAMNHGSTKLKLFQIPSHYGQQKCICKECNSFTFLSNDSAAGLTSRKSFLMNKETVGSSGRWQIRVG